MNPYAVGQLWAKGAGVGLYLLLAPLGRGEDVDKDIWWFKWRVAILYPDGEIKISEPFLHKDPKESSMTRVA